MALSPGRTVAPRRAINSYKRFGPGTLAPWLIDWGLDNRSAMIRIPHERVSGARLELPAGCRP
jgi:glutamine synthetase